MKFPSEEYYVKEYMNYTNQYLSDIEDKYGKIENDIATKQNHGLAMKDSVLELTKKSGMFNETYNESGKIEGCFHDIGRFKQYLDTKTLNDSKLKLYNCNDHGQLGKMILLENNKELLRRFIPTETEYDNILLEVIGEHTVIRNDDYIYPIDEFKTLFIDNSIDDILNSNDKKVKDKLIALKLMILRECDSLEIYMNIINGPWNPYLSTKEEDFVSKEILNDFINFNYIDKNKYIEKKLWTCNAGKLLRLGLITNNVQFVSSLREIKENNWLDKLHQRSIESIEENNEYKIMNDPSLIFATEYVKLAIDNLINTSPDGLIITNESRLEAKVKTKKAIK